MDLQQRPRATWSRPRRQNCGPAPHMAPWRVPVRPFFAFDLGPWHDRPPPKVAGVHRAGYDPAIGGAAKLGSTDLGRGGRDRRKRLATGQPMLATSGGRSASGEGRCVAAADDLRPGSTRVWVVARRGGGLGSLGPAGSAKPIVMMHCNRQ